MLNRTCSEITLLIKYFFIYKIQTQDFWLTKNNLVYYMVVEFYMMLVPYLSKWIIPFSLFFYLLNIYNLLSLSNYFCDFFLFSWAVSKSGSHMSLFLAIANTYLINFQNNKWKILLQLLCLYGICTNTQSL